MDLGPGQQLLYLPHSSVHWQWWLATYSDLTDSQVLKTYKWDENQQLKNKRAMLGPFLASKIHCYVHPYWTIRAIFTLLSQKHQFPGVWIMRVKCTCYSPAG